jgi:hypothetical protein
MPELKWNEYDFIECFGVLPEKEEFFTSHYFRVVKDELLLEMTIWQYESCIAISISKATDKIPFFSVHFLVRDEVVFINEKESAHLKFQDCILVSSRFWMYEERMKLSDKQSDYFDKETFPEKLDFELHSYPRIKLKFD